MLGRSASATAWIPLFLRWSSARAVAVLDSLFARHDVLARFFVSVRLDGTRTNQAKRLSPVR